MRWGDIVFTVGLGPGAARQACRVPVGHIEREALVLLSGHHASHSVATKDPYGDNESL